MRKSLPFIIIALVVTAIALYFTLSIDGNGTSVKSQTDFAIEDTSAIGKIFIAAPSGKQALIERKENGRWMVNDKYTAREDAVQTLLKTFKNVYIQRPVAKEIEEQAIRVMAAGAKKVEVYDRKGKWMKTWYVGHATSDKKGTFMILETPGGGKSTVPYIMDLRGFIGMLNTRFFTDENEWRGTRVFQYSEPTLSEISIQYPSEPENSFMIKYAGGNELALFAGNGATPIAPFDTSLVKDYMLNFKLASFENYRTGLSQLQEDSVKATAPYQVIKIKDAKMEHVVRLWPKGVVNEPASDSIDPTLSEVDKERVYADWNSGELATAQRLTWDRFRAPLAVFLPKAENK